jgi:hypothetical protein
MSESLFDSSEPIREFAQFTLRRLGFDDLADRYRSVLHHGDNLASAISGLGQTGSRADVRLIEPSFRSPWSKVRKAAVTAIGRLLGDDGVEQLLPMIADRSPKVARAALAMVSQRANLISLASLEGMFDSSPKHSQLLLVELLDKMDLWRSLPSLLRIVVKANHIVARRVVELLPQRFNRVFTTPTAEQRHQLESVLEDKAVQLPQLVETELRRWLKFRLQ